MNKAKWKVTITCFVVSCLLTAGTALGGEPTFIVDSNVLWNSLLHPEPNASMIVPVSLAEWNEYVQDWNQGDGNGFPIDSIYCVPELYVYEGNDPCYPQDTACLVMAWGGPDQNVPDTNYSAAYKFVYGIDPELHDCTITFSVQYTGSMFPPFIPSVVFGLQDDFGKRVWWTWRNILPKSTTTTIKINTRNIYLGKTAPSRTATDFNCECNFNLSKVKYFITGISALSATNPPAPPPGGSGGPYSYSNLTFNFSVTKNVSSGKDYIKWSQRPMIVDANQPPIISGWDQRSDYNNQQWQKPMKIVADDWNCSDFRPVTDIHWWGSFIDWNQPHLPPILPKTFHIGIWTDVPKDPCGPNNISHPGKLVWKTDCNNWVWNFAGLDRDPCNVLKKKDACFQFNQLLSQDQWFYQEPNCICKTNNGSRVYWLSIAAVYNPQDYNKTGLFYPWGWKTRAHNYNDDAVVITDVNFWPPDVNKTTWKSGQIIRPGGWDAAFELSTNEPGPPSTDLNKDGIVNFLDFAIFAQQWLTVWP